MTKRSKMPAFRTAKEGGQGEQKDRGTKAITFKRPAGSTEIQKVADVITGEMVNPDEAVRITIDRSQGAREGDTVKEEVFVSPKTAEELGAEAGSTITAKKFEAAKEKAQRAKEAANQE